MSIATGAVHRRHVVAAARRSGMLGSPQSLRCREFIDPAVDLLQRLRKPPAVRIDDGQLTGVNKWACPAEKTPAGQFILGNQNRRVILYVGPQSTFEPPCLIWRRVSRSLTAPLKANVVIVPGPCASYRGSLVATPISQKQERAGGAQVQTPRSHQGSKVPETAQLSGMCRRRFRSPRYILAASLLLVQIAGEILEARIDGHGCHYLARAELSCQLERADQIETR